MGERSVLAQRGIHDRGMKICQANTPEQLATVRALFEEYASWIGVDLSYQGFAEELQTLPGAYAPPGGRLLLAEIDGEPVACVALRALEANVCEMKRLFVRSGFRGRGLGKVLVERAIEEARGLGYATLKLDTLPFMHQAIRLYETLGFARCAPYYETPIDGTVFMELTL